MALRAIPARAESLLSSAWTGIARLARTAPFGIGTVVIILCGALVAIGGAVLAIGTPQREAPLAFGQLQPYPREPSVAWSTSSATLPDYSSDVPIDIAATDGRSWLLRYPSGTGYAYLLVDRDSGHRLWDSPLPVGVGSCALTSSGQVGCAVNAAGQRDPGFYLVDAEGTARRSTPLEDTTAVLGLGTNFLRINASRNLISLQSPDGRQRWSRSFDSTPTAEVTENGLLEVTTVDAERVILDPATGTPLLQCRDCAISGFPSGITVDTLTPSGHEFVSYTVENGKLDLRPKNHITGMRPLAGPSTFAVLTPEGPAQMQATQGRYVVLDPATTGTRWQISDPELSKANTRPCGSFVAFARKDRTRVLYTLDDGVRLGSLPAPSITDPDTNLDYLRCVGSTGDSVLFASPSQLTAIDATTGTIAWTFAIAGQVQVIDGYLVMREGTTLRVLRPHRTATAGL